MVTAMRLDVEEQILEVKETLEMHSSLKNPHPNLEEWIREADKRCLHEIGIVRNEHHERLKKLEEDQISRRGASQAKQPLNAYLMGVLSAVTAAVAVTIVLGILKVISFN